MNEPQCYECQKTASETDLKKCPVCHRHFCEDHASVMSGRPFCSKGCAQHFFFSEADD